MLQFSHPSPIREGKKDRFVMFDSPAEIGEYAETHCKDTHAWRNSDRSWFGGLTAEDSVRNAKIGDISRVADTEKLMDKFESFQLETSRRGWRDDVVGAFPNVPAFVSGVPCSMRRRAPADPSANAPIAVIIDLTTSAGIDAKNVERRGAAILALVRIFSSRRPIELWVGCGLDADNRSNCGFVLSRIDTTPLDLATAAFAIGSAAFPRRLCYSVAHKSFGFQGKWPYGEKSLTSNEMTKVLAPAFTHTTETLCIPGIHRDDESVGNPEKWLADRLEALSPVALDAA